MAKLVDPRNPRWEYEPPIQRYTRVLPLERDAMGKRGLPGQFGNFKPVTEPYYSPPTTGKREISLFSVQVETLEDVRRGAKKWHSGLVLTEDGGANISLEISGSSVKIFRAGESGVSEVQLGPKLLLRLSPSLAVRLMELKPPHLDVYLIGVGTKMVRLAHPSDLMDYALDSTALFMLGPHGLFSLKKFKSVTVFWA